MRVSRVAQTAACAKCGRAFALNADQRSDSARTEVRRDTAAASRAGVSALPHRPDSSSELLVLCAPVVHTRPGYPQLRLHLVDRGAVARQPQDRQITSDWEVNMEAAAQAADRRTDELGKRGEDVAAEYLAGIGLVVLSRNWRCREGELDLVATDGDRLVVISHR
jgi:Uncharacterised protein family UPF0102